MEINRFLRRWIKPRFFVCEWEIIGEMNGMWTRGEFSLYSNAPDEAKDCACRFIEHQLRPGMRALVNIRSATWRERLRCGSVNDCNIEKEMVEQRALFIKLKREMESAGVDMEFGVDAPLLEDMNMAAPEELEALANRIDHEELWRWPGMDHHKMTPEQKDRMWAGVYLRQYASLLRNNVGIALE